MYLEKVVHRVVLDLFRASKFDILENKDIKFQYREPVRIRGRDDPAAGQSNIITLSHCFCVVVFLLFFLLSLLFSGIRQLRLLEVYATRVTFSLYFSCTTVLILKETGAISRDKKGFHQNALLLANTLQTQFALRKHPFGTRLCN